MKKKVRVVSITTEKADNKFQLLLYKRTNELNYYQVSQKGLDSDDNLEAQHLYLISDDEINQMDYYYDSEMNIIAQRTLSADQYEGCKKVIASTDSELKITKSATGITDGGRARTFYSDEHLPQIPESFIKAFVKANGNIDEVMVEYEETGWHSKGKFHVTNSNPKLRDDNTVIIHLEEEKMYSREEVEALIKKAFIAGGKDYVNGTFDGPDNFIKENL